MSRIPLSGLFVLALSLPAAAEASAGAFGPVRDIFVARCAMCHEWAATPDGVVTRVTPGHPEASDAYLWVVRDEMPPGDPLIEADRSLIRDWILAGALTADAASPSPDAGRFLGFPSKVSFHKVSGFTSGALLLGAGVAGAVQWATLITAAHDYRDANSIDENTMSPACNDYIRGLWADGLHTGLRVAHVSLLGTGELLYIANAMTGLGMLTADRPGLTPQDLHRYAFFTHGTLMVSQLILGFVTTSLLSQGNHWTMIGVGAAHTVIGFAIPAVMVASGVLISRAMR